MPFTSVVVPVIAELFSPAVRQRFVQPLSALLLLAALLLPTAHAADPRVQLSTSLGDIVLELDEKRAPQTVRNFLDYVDSGFYDQTLFHRVIEGFMIQGGGFNQNYQKKATRAPISNEAYNGLRNDRYTIAMARTTAPHSATSQFFINSEDNRNLDHTDTTQRGWGYTVFGRVIEGKSVVDAISRSRTGPGGPFSRDVPVEPVVILSATRQEPSVTNGNDLMADEGSPRSASARSSEGDRPVKASTDQTTVQTETPVEQN
ncbi:peptidylprolyl isomerase [Granulosicoccus sp. 3-233]|uniref:peptidylprolyl isomerase n=1 Tax=Granulosicoccus sp. 3-233 TaxID=3417969 RepID=UPI003D351EBF